MGNWNINIQGVGCHHNAKPEIDADLAAAEFVKTLKAQGHTIESATFTYGGKTDLVDRLAVDKLVAAMQASKEASAATAKSMDALIEAINDDKKPTP